jgi:hypothetical protein
MGKGHRQRIPRRRPDRDYERRRRCSGNVRLAAPAGLQFFRPLSNARPGIMQMIGVHLPTTDGRELVLTRYTEPEPDLSLLLEKLKLELPAQPPPKSPPGPFRRSRCSADLRGSVYAISNT